MWSEMAAVWYFTLKNQLKTCRRDGGVGGEDAQLGKDIR